MSNRLRVGIVGIGNRSLPKRPDTSNWDGWASLVASHEGMILTCACDPALDARDRLVDRGYLNREDVFPDLEGLLAQRDVDALIISSPAEFHADAIGLAGEAGLHVLVEKPFVTDVDDGRRLADAFNARQLTCCVIQNWRYKDVGAKIQAFIESGSLGTVGHVFFRYVRNRENPNYPAYIFEEAHPLLYAMGIHHFDLIRFSLNDEFHSVIGQSFKPPWSHYQSVTGVNLTFRTHNDVIVIYSGTISSKNTCLPLESLIIEGEKGTLVNESDWSDPPLLFYPEGAKTPVDLTSVSVGCDIKTQYDRSDQKILDHFFRAIAYGDPPLCTAKDALESVVAVEKCREACETGELILF